MKKLVFFPWEQVQASEIRKMTSWDRTGDFVFDNYTGSPVANVKGRVLGGQIYIFAHCKPGSTTIQNDAGQKLSYQELGLRLEASGLKKAYSGAIKIYACNSGTPSVSFAFAKLFAKYMYFEKKYLLARVYGYEAILSSQMDEVEWLKVNGADVDGVTRTKAHKQALYYSDAKNYTSTKAKDARSYFSPF